MSKARILEIKAGGVVVLLENNEKVWLPGQELSTQDNPSRKLTEQSLCRENQELEVIEYGKELGGKQKLVSYIRFSNDPWKKVRTWQVSKPIVLSLIGGKKVSLDLKRSFSYLSRNYLENLQPLEENLASVSFLQKLTDDYKTRQWDGLLIFFL